MSARMTRAEDLIADERDRLVRRAREDIAQARKTLDRLEDELTKGASGQPYRRVAGNTTMSHATPIDLSVVNAAFDAVERAASI